MGGPKHNEIELCDFDNHLVLRILTHLDVVITIIEHPDILQAPVTEKVLVLDELFEQLPSVAIWSWSLY